MVKDGDGLGLFGDKDWDDVHGQITRRVKRSFPRAGIHNVEDAVQTAVMNLFAVWKDYPSTSKHAEPEKLFWFAVKWGTGRANQYLIQELHRHEREVSFDQRLGESDEPLWEILPDYAPSPEDIVFANEEKAELHKMLGEMSQSDLQSWLLPIANGEGVRAQARREAVHHSTVEERRSRGLCRLRKLVTA